MTAHLIFRRDKQKVLTSWRLPLSIFSRTRIAQEIQSRHTLTEVQLTRRTAGVHLFMLKGLVHIYCMSSTSLITMIYYPYQALVFYIYMYCVSFLFTDLYVMPVIWHCSHIYKFTHHKWLKAQDWHFSCSKDQLLLERTHTCLPA